MTCPDGAVEVPLTKGLVALIDVADAEQILARKWCAAECWDGLFYAKRGTRRPDGVRTTEFMHTVLTGWPLVDHRNGNGLDNRRANLRPATAGQNSANSRVPAHNRSGFKGVCWDSARDAWRATITADGQHHNLGRFPTADAAAHAYDDAAREYHGEFARLNFPAEVER